MVWTSRPDQSAVLLEEDPVAHFVTLPNYEEDETVLRETLKKSSLPFLSRETHAHGVSDGPSRDGNGPPPSRM